MSKKIRGSSLLKTNIVGTYHLQTKTVSLQAKPQVAAERQPQQGDNVVNANKGAEGSCIRLHFNLAKSRKNGQEDKMRMHVRDGEPILARWHMVKKPNNGNVDLAMASSG
ncbi:hypothetical protein RHMOL_Rhmol09G0025800 [Rhododendron molle]|uniref:Uncharacterized protein n=1 Tax=Rhododendron molle TaxID=49168 RepID=A0ACC0M952_RHOML|nr:hypothetical protein RHMOL_Rhmol09G0025800 [Rhododendron molle]